MMRFSVIIPAYNAEETLGACVDSIFATRNNDLELIIVDSASNDKSVKITKEYPCRLIRLKKNRGAGHARNVGSEDANGEILVFIDSDVAVKKDALDIIDESFKKDNDIVAVTCILSKESHHKNFFSQYKNLYMHYTYKKCPKYVDFLYGSLMAIKKEHFLKFNEKVLMEDTELGQRYKRLNKKILLNKKLQVAHLKKYNFKSIIANDFSVPFWWVKIFLLHKGYKDIFKKQRFSHAHLNQITSMAVSYMIAIPLIFSKQQQAMIIPPLILTAYLLLNQGFLSFMYRDKGLIFLVKSIAFGYLDALVMGAGVFSGFIYFNSAGKKR